ncbi:chemotaxis protein CheW [Sphingomonas sp. NBWT7]|uniref:chemotaxis protein CheW n=1 Tax=Sphingomonas sp. NBWT7 TaxID=2596913 RepID=UPI00162445E0|nr:CheW domain-containing protein [Sphingomonas sp. NBWT7]QNE31291.1 chemotaxis protein CheW [Sphingomonas sp. NBWT7]
MNEALHLLARVADRAIAVPAAMVDSVVDVPAIVPAPRAHPAVRGLAALRSRVVTVVDSWHLLGLGNAPLDVRRAILTVVDGHHHAILVDTLHDVLTLAVEPVPAGMPLGPRWGPIVVGASVHDGEPLLIVDIAALVRTMGRAD